ncbi:hypothetical protein T265_08076 [Opisthorchis viverrini]|uniref:Uncharacterized protein n=1 Tax=Opisthorchis viverrini TaxID=6198 RepID=A0A074ZAU6_OPIVI|nr:hypothetical protein T265_08076 [Opisthorchis viverrini]KER24233.1 hypothetical protein T265_08076 [Opisthorchis viverrini]
MKHSISTRVKSTQSVTTTATNGQKPSSFNFIARFRSNRAVLPNSSMPLRPDGQPSQHHRPYFHAYNRNLTSNGIVITTRTAESHPHGSLPSERNPAIIRLSDTSPFQTDQFIYLFTQANHCFLTYGLNPAIFTGGYLVDCIHNHDADFMDKSADFTQVPPMLPQLLMVSWT